MGYIKNALSDGLGNAYDYITRAMNVISIFLYNTGLTMKDYVIEIFMEQIRKLQNKVSYYYRLIIINIKYLLNKIYYGNEYIEYNDNEHNDNEHNDNEYSYDEYNDNEHNDNEHSDNYY